MFRDLKEYQEIAKIYTEKVSKVSEPENLEERSRSNPSGLTPEQKKANQKGFVNRILFGNPEGKRAKPSNKRAEAAKKRREMQKPKKKMSNIPVIDGPVNNPEYGKNMSRSKEDLNPKKPEPPKATESKPKPLTTKQKFDKKFIKKDKGVGFVKRGTPGAQRAENKEKARNRAKEMAKARIAAKKKAEMSESVDLTPYDLVLEYLLSTEQAATIEEANYVMTEMDAETIQGIVEAQKKNLEEGLPLLAKGAMVVGGTVLAKKGLDKAKEKFDNFLNKQRDKGIGGNTRPGSDKMYYGDKKKK